MSKIKDLLAVEQEIDDLMPTDKERLAALFPAIREKIYKSAISPETEEELYKDAEFSFGEDDEGHSEMYVENFVQMCHGIAEDKITEYIEENHWDITNEQYWDTVEWIGDKLADHYADLECDIIKDAENDIRYEGVRYE